MAYPGDNRKISFIRSVGFALQGILTSFRERNIIIHYIAAVVAVVAGVFFSISSIEWLFVITSIAGVIVLEMVNTAIEKVVDLITSDYHILAEKAKDLAAGAVLIYAIYSMVVGVIIFLPKIYDFIS
ncbi:diacylglycerol kinase family protein [Bacillus massiliigorillae]|uniref:diacylglycerol kinase family protein n=1 Tax=Bacillus massiliigorillae TaxID=1243664 RepID=UPI0003A64D7F|nr:diacylglycerol kinase family protein [Bacillus massiliigorillae]